MAEGLSPAMRDLLWEVARQENSFMEVAQCGPQLRTAEALVSRGLLTWGTPGTAAVHEAWREGRSIPQPPVLVTPEGFNQVLLEAVRIDA